MAVYYEVQKEQNFLHFIGYGQITSKDVQKFCEYIPELVRQSDLSKVLVDARGISNSLNISERFQYAIEIAKYFNGLKIAIVADVPLRDPDLFGETVAKNRGADIRICINMDEAYEWLKVAPVCKLKTD